jgi:hypothetical protein
MENRTCQGCQKSFTIETEDFAFYEKIRVPAPTFCPECRLARKLAWRNERSLYRRACDLCKKNVISMYRADAEFPVYCHECYWGDKWSASDYGQDYNFSKPFFAQFAELQKKVPRPNLYSAVNVNSDYCNYTAHMKNCYLLFGSWFSEDSSYGQTVLKSKDCWDCIFVRECERCYGLIDSTKCNLTHMSQNCTGCFDSVFLYDCRNCTNCLFSWNLRNKSYYVWNKQVTKEEYEKARKEIFSSHESFMAAWNKFRETIKNEALNKFMTGDHNNNVSGEFISNSKNVFKSYYVDKGENEKYAVRGGVGQKDAMDVFGVHAGELAYECNNIDFSSRALFSINGENHLNVDYVVDSTDLKNAFGCISLRKKEYCILNRQYEKQEYEELREKIIAHMNEMPYIDSKGRTYSYGEFSPIEISPSSYNETLAQEYVPLTNKIAEERGYSWYTPEDKNYTPTKSWKDLPVLNSDINDSILKETILCQAWDEDKEKAQEHKCSMAFKITPDELAMYKKWGIPLPRKCPNTRSFEMSGLRNPVAFWYRTCMCNNVSHFHGDTHCEIAFETSYSPDRPEIVYCEKCYQQEVV